MIRLVSLALCVFASGLASAQMPVTKVVVTKARLFKAPATITVVGTVEPLRRSRVGTEIAGLIVEMPIREGDVVELGDRICMLKDDLHVLRLAEEKARLAMLRARQEELLAGTRKEELVRLKALLEETTADFERWQFEMRRIESLYEGRDSNAKEYHDTQADFRRSQRRRTAAQASYDLAVAGPRKEVLAQAGYAVAQQQAVADRIETELGKTSIVAPFGGSIIARHVEVGEWIDTGDVVVEIVDLSSVLVRVDLPESALPFLKLGASALVKVDALKQTFEGKVKHILRQADRQAHTFPVQIAVANSERSLAAGMFARVTLPAGPEHELVATPKDSIVERDGVPYVAVVIPGRDGQDNGVLMPVTLGAEAGPKGEWVTITSDNLSAGQRVIVRGNERVLPFPMPVEIVDDYGTPVAMPSVATKRRGDEGA